MNSPPSSHTRVDVLGVSVSAIDMQTAISNIREWISQRVPNYICVTPLHSIVDADEDADFRRILNASGMTTPDGMSVVWFLRRLGFAVERVYGPDLMLETFRVSEAEGWRHFLYGGAPGVAETLAAKLSERFPRANIVGTLSPPFRPLTEGEQLEIRSRIDFSEADIVWVGISSPKQERWMAANVGQVRAPLLVGVGAAFDFLSGNKSQAPRFIQRSGFEWLYRWASEPRRLAVRYMKYPRYVRRLLVALATRKELS